MRNGSACLCSDELVSVHRAPPGQGGHTDNMPADFLTKFLGKIKLQKSLERATNGKLALPPR